MSRLPRIDASWTRSGWVVESAHVPGAYRMLGIWAASFVSIPFVIAVLDGPLGLHAAMVAALVVSVAGLLAGAVVYARVSRSLALPDGEPWDVGPAPEVWRSLGTSVLPRVDDEALAEVVLSRGAR